MPIVRGHHSFDDKFTQIPNAWLRDSRLSLKAIGLLAQLMSHEPGWQLSVNSLAYANQVGKDAIRSAVGELEEFGYLLRVQTREEGKFSETIWYTQDPSDPCQDKKPLAENPTSDNPHLKNNNNKNTNLRIITPKVKDFEDAFNEFWKFYPRKTDKLVAKKSLNKLLSEDPGLESQILQGVKRLAADPNLPEVRYIKHPATWLNAGGWDNDPYPERQISQEELDKQLADFRLKKRLADRERTLKIIQETQAAAQSASPPPKCIHGNSVVSCLPCLKILSDRESD